MNAWTLTYGLFGAHRTTFFKTTDINTLNTGTAPARAVTMWHEMKGHNQDNANDGADFDAKYEEPVLDAMLKLKKQKIGCAWCSPKGGSQWALGDALDKAMCDCEISHLSK